MAYKVGDKVRVLNAKKIQFGERYWNDGDISEIKRLLDDGRPCLSRNTKELDDRGLPLWSSELKYIEKVEESDAKMTQFKVGDKVRVIGVGAAGLPLGTEAKVTQVDWDGDVYLDIKNAHGNKAFYLSRNIELVSPKPTKNQRLTSAEQAITALEQTVADLQAEVEALKATQKPKSILSGEGTLIFDGKPIAKVSGISYKDKTPNEQASANQKRKAIIDEAKAFLVEVEREQNDSKVRDKGNAFHRQYLTKTEFIVNAEKRTVVAIIRAKYGTTLLTKGIAKCAPSDVFNEHIGKAIALGRALGLDVSKFEKAVQPTELVVGHIVTKVNGSCGLGRIGSVEDGKARIEDQFGFWETTIANSSTLLELDDTEAKY